MESGDHREVVNGMSRITNRDDLFSVTIPKSDCWDGLLKYISRNPVPYPYGPTEDLWKRSYKQVCIYGFYKHHLEKFLEQSEKD